MSNSDRILWALGQHGPLSDTDLVRITGIRPHQQVNQICRRLAAQGLIRRLHNVGGPILNALVVSDRPTPTPDPSTSPSSPPRTAPALLEKRNRSDLLAPGPSTLFVLPCSGTKRTGGFRGLEGPSVLHLLSADVAERLRRARESLRVAGKLDDSLLLPAWQRYDGYLYKAAHPALGKAVADGIGVVILSGGYGVLLADEPIGYYNRRFSKADWPAGLLERCLAEVAVAKGTDRVVAFCARTTSYAEVLRRVRWEGRGIEAHLLTPDLGGGGGGQVLVPRASGEAVRAALDGRLSSTWRSSDGLALTIESLR